MEAVLVLMGQFADYGKADPDVYAEGLKSLFMDYPEVVVEQVAKGLPSKQQWFPSMYEVKEALEDAQDPGRKFRMAKATTPDTFSKEPDTSKELKGRRYKGTKVYEDGKGIVSHKFGEWDGKPCIAQDDPNRPKAWHEQRHYSIEELMANAEVVRDNLGGIRDNNE